MQNKNQLFLFSNMTSFANSQQPSSEIFQNISDAREFLKNCEENGEILENGSVYLKCTI